jgi:predicted PurR-regulated permease PerM
MWMAESGHSQAKSPGARRFSFYFMAGALVLLITLRLATPLLAALFTYLALTRLHFFRRGGKWFAILVFLVFLGAIAYGLGYFVRQTVKALPEIADKAIPSVIETARQKGIELPFTDYDSLKEVAFDTVKREVHYLGSFAKFARGASTHLLFLAAGCVIAMGAFLNPQFELGRQPSEPRTDLYAQACTGIRIRFQNFYQSFVTVMGAQIIISAINTVLTAIFVLAMGLPYAVVITGVTFLCGLVPVVGNLISNTIVVAIGFTVSPKMALGALIFLVAIHKLEYLLNSKVVGWRIRNPLWLTLLGLIVGERLLGLPGMILAPVMLNYIKLEASRIKQGGPQQTEDENELKSTLAIR